MKVIAIPEYCLGCGLCEIYCAAQHDGYNGNVIKAYKKGNPVTPVGFINPESDILAEYLYALRRRPPA